MAFAKLRGTVRSLISVWFVLLAIVVVGAGALGAMYVGVLDNPLSDIHSAEVSDEGDLVVEIAEDHEGNFLILQHEYDDDSKIIADREVPRFGGTLRFDLDQTLACDADYPTRTFRVSLVSLDDSMSLGIDKHATRKVSIPTGIFEDISNTTC